jgi:transposase
MRERFVLLKRRGDLSMPEEISFSSWTKNFPVLGEAYALKESFYGIWDNQNRSQAEKACLAWKAEISPKLQPHFAPLLTAIDNWWDEIFNYFEHPITNAYTESLNSLIRVMNRLGRGYSFDALRAKILFTEGIQKVKRPNYRRQPLPAAAFGRSVAVPLPEPINYGADISTIAQLLGGEDF